MARTNGKLISIAPPQRRKSRTNEILEDLHHFIRSHDDRLSNLEGNDIRQFKILDDIQATQTKLLAQEMANERVDEIKSKRSTEWRNRATIIGVAFGVLSTLTTMVEVLFHVK